MKQNFAAILFGDTGQVGEATVTEQLGNQSGVADGLG
jgi:hypothetical protein